MVSQIVLKEAVSVTKCPLTGFDAAIHIKQGRLRRIADLFFPDDTRIVIQNCIVEQITLHRILDVKFGRLDHCSAHIDLFYGHLVLSQRSCLIGADHRDTAEALNRL